MLLDFEVREYNVLGLKKNLKNFSRELSLQ